MKISVIGLGYVGFELFKLLFKNSKENFIQGYDCSEEKIKNIPKEFSLNISSNENSLQNSNVFIVCVPTPLDSDNYPDYSYINGAIKTISNYINKNSTIIIESTITPGYTESCIDKILSKNTELKYGDFSVVFAPERFAPNSDIPMECIDKLIGYNDIRGKEIANKIYSSFMKSPLHFCSIKEAEFSKLMENTQRETLISFANQMYMIANEMNINFDNVLKMAETKYNFVKDIKPGFVGGHCLSVDSIFLRTIANTKYVISTHLIDEVIENNNSIIDYEVRKIVKLNKEIKSLIVVLKRVSYKPNSDDIRNSKQIEFYNKLKRNGISVFAFDSNVNRDEVYKKHNIELITHKDFEYLEKTYTKISYNKIGDYEIWI